MLRIVNLSSGLISALKTHGDSQKKSTVVTEYKWPGTGFKQKSAHEGVHTHLRCNGSPRKIQDCSYATRSESVIALHRSMQESSDSRRMK